MKSTRTNYSFSIDNSIAFKKQILHYYKTEQYVMFLESNDGGTGYDTYESLVAVGCIDQITSDYKNAFNKLEQFRAEYKDWIFGYLGYDLKNDVEQLSSDNIDDLGFADLCFFIPEFVMEITNNQVILHSYHSSKEKAAQLIDTIQQQSINQEKIAYQQSYLTARDTKEEYLEKVNKFLHHIQRGDIYEANFCTSFYAHDVDLDTFKAFEELNAISEPPFAVYAKLSEHFIISASPERYLKKTGEKIISQPIKGTAKRSVNLMEDHMLSEQLLHDPKERSENVMIVDLVRNDLSRTAQKNSVMVEELFGIYTFKQVHQMISTISSKMKPNYSIIDLLKTTFPMGSMTGAPKISAMKIIEENETFKRGVYSGAVGYIKPDGDADFNVIIRTILYNRRNGHLSFSVGSAITAAAKPDKEYQECLLKANAMVEVLSKQGISFKKN